MITKAEIMETAALKIDLSTFPAEALEKMNEMFNGDYAGAMAETDAAIERGVDLFLSAVGRPVEVWSDGKAKATAVARIDYDPKDDYYILEFRDKGRFMFRNGGFSSLGHTGEFYGIVNDPEKKSGIKFINYKPGE